MIAVAFSDLNEGGEQEKHENLDVQHLAPGDTEVKQEFGKHLLTYGHAQVFFKLMALELFQELDVVVVPETQVVLLAY